MNLLLLAHSAAKLLVGLMEVIRTEVGQVFESGDEQFANGGAVSCEDGDVAGITKTGLSSSFCFSSTPLM
jgi:hypothetical protein